MRRLGIWALACLVALILSGCFEPKAPSNLSANVQINKIALSWQDNSGTERGFYVYKRLCSTGDFTRIAELSANITGYDDTDITIDECYEYYVTAWNIWGESGASNTLTVKTIPNAPTNLNASGTGLGSINLSWTDNSSVESGFAIERRKVGETECTVLVNTAPNTTSYTDNIGECGTSYEYRVAAFNETGYSDYTEPKSADPCEGLRTKIIDQTSEPYQFESVSLATSQLGKAHIAYHFWEPVEAGQRIFRLILNTLKYATNSSGSWRIDIVSEMAGTFNSIVVKPDGKVRIAYFGGLNTPTYFIPENSPQREYWLDTDPYYCKLISTGDFYSEPIFSCLRGLYTNLALDPSGRSHICYVSQKPDDKFIVRCMWDIEGSPRRETIAVGEAPSLAFDSSGVAHVAYSDGEKIKYATNKTGDWQSITIDTGEVGCPKVAVDADGAVHMIYKKGASLIYATNKTGFWQIEVAVSSIADRKYWDAISLALDTSGKAQVSYISPTDALMYATNKSGSWTTMTLDTTKTQSTALALDSDGYLHIAYATYEPQRLLKYITNRLPENKE